MTHQPPALEASNVPARARPSSYPEPFASRMEGRVKRPLGDLFGLKNFGVNLTTLRPGQYLRCTIATLARTNLSM
jgi:uncharacterized cupin superfamily protein